MYVNMENYKEEEVKSEENKGFLHGMEEGISDIDSAFSNYINDMEESEPSSTLLEIKKEIIKGFVDFAKKYISDEKDMFLVSFIESQEK